jgi:hypothetical protein
MNNRHNTAEPWAEYQPPRGGRDDLAPCVAIVYGALAIGMRPDGRICLAILRRSRRMGDSDTAASAQLAGLMARLNNVFAALVPLIDKVVALACDPALQNASAWEMNAHVDVILKLRADLIAAMAPTSEGTAR